ncbi:MAG: type II toxin-antitoxin system VapC family toxin [Acidobacteriota bacterium]
MNSLDTNILIYATNENCPEHLAAKEIYERLLKDPLRWIIADQVLFEFYRALRSPRILENPLSAEGAADQIRFLRDEAGSLHCSYEGSFWNEVLGWLARADFRPGLIFDLILAVTLKANGVQRFYTRNIKDFQPLGFFELVDPTALTS